MILRTELMIMIWKEKKEILRFEWIKRGEKNREDALSFYYWVPFNWEIKKRFVWCHTTRLVEGFSFFYGTAHLLKGFSSDLACKKVEIEILLTTTRFFYGIDSSSIFFLPSSSASFSTFHWWHCGSLDCEI